MTAPVPPQGTANPYTLAYQNSQFGIDTPAAAVTPAFTVFSHLVNPPAAGVTASASPSILFLENTNPVNQNPQSVFVSVPLVNPYSRPAGS